MFEKGLVRIERGQLWPDWKWWFVWCDIPSLSDAGGWVTVSGDNVEEILDHVYAGFDHTKPHRIVVRGAVEAKTVQAMEVTLGRLLHAEELKILILRGRLP